MKNIEKIRKMNSEELINIFKTYRTDECSMCSYKDKYCGTENCTIGLNEWLNQEAELTTEDISNEFRNFCNENRSCDECKYKRKTCHNDYTLEHFNIIDGKITRR